MHPDASTAIRAQLIAAMAQRAATLHGEARRVLDARLAQLRAADTEARTEPPAAPGASVQPGALRQLAEQLAGEPSAERSAYPEVPALAEFRQLWSSLRADSQLQRSVAHAPADAGPLNSSALASRAIALMRELSPGYLRAFLAYVDDLSWLEQVSGAGQASGAPTSRKRASRQPRR